MTLPQTASVAVRRNSNWRAFARRYSTTPWVLAALGGLAISLGLFFGGWGWLVAAGLAPIVLSTLPCLVMCGLGVCMMCRSGPKQTTASHEVTNTTASSAALGSAESDSSPASAMSCCQGEVGQVRSSPVADLRPNLEGKEESHA